MKKKKLPKLLNIITSRFFCVLRNKRISTKQYHACEKLMVNLLLVLKYIYIYIFLDYVFVGINK